MLHSQISKVTHAASQDKMCLYNYQKWWNSKDRNVCHVLDTYTTLKSHSLIKPGLLDNRGMVNKTCTHVTHQCWCVADSWSREVRIAAQRDVKWTNKNTHVTVMMKWVLLWGWKNNPQKTKPACSCRLNCVVLKCDTAWRGGGRGGGGGGRGLLGLSTYRITNIVPAVGRDTCETRWTFAGMSETPGEVLHVTSSSCTHRTN